MVELWDCVSCMYASIHYSCCMHACVSSFMVPCRYVCALSRVACDALSFSTRVIVLYRVAAVLPKVGVPHPWRLMVDTHS